MNYEFDLQQLVRLRHAELLREASNQRLADQVVSSTLVRGNPTSLKFSKRLVYVR